MAMMRFMTVTWAESSDSSALVLQALKAFESFTLLQSKK